jgi:hypothetical protein
MIGLCLCQTIGIEFLIRIPTVASPRNAVLIPGHRRPVYDEAKRRLKIPSTRGAKITGDQFRERATLNER